MVQVNTDTPYGEITIQGGTFSYPRPYLAGPHTLTEGEASTLNQTLGENLRNNFAAVIRGKFEDYRKANNMAEDADVGIDVLDKDALDDEFSSYAEKYEFGVRQASAGPRTPTDPVGKEANKIAWDRIKTMLTAKGIKLDSVDKEKRASLIQQVIEKYPDVREEAQRRVDAAANIAIEGLEGLAA